MRPQKTDRTLAVGGAVAGVSFGISKADEAHIMGILRDTLYSDKKLAVLREYSANAWDANRVAGRGHVPIEVHLPTDDDRYLRIKDSGPGLSRDDVFNVFTQYGASTKRDRDDAVGMLGIGSKSAFSYADSFTVISRHAEMFTPDFEGPRCGFRSTYVASLDPSDRGVINLLAEEAWDPADTGVEIVIATQPDDEYEFRQKAKALYRFFEPRPTINTDLPAAPDQRVTLASGEINYSFEEGGANPFGGWVAVMGCVPYRVRLQELTLPKEHRCLHKLSGVLRFDMGAVHFTGSREELRYTQKTKDALVEKFTTLVDEFVSKALEILDGDAETDWQKRLRVRVLQELDLDLPDEYQDLGKSWVKLFDDSDIGPDGKSGGPFRLVRNDATTNQVTVDKALRFLIDDTGKKLAGYSLDHFDYVVRAKNQGKAAPTEAETAALEATLTATLKACRLEGARVARLSTLHFNAPFVPGFKSPELRAKHRAMMFSFKGNSTRFTKPYSDHWEAVTRAPEDSDVYVVLEKFDSDGFYNTYREDKAIADALDVEMPTIFGYKETHKKPLDRSKLAGTEYSVWRKTWLAGLATPERMSTIQEILWAEIGPASSAPDKFLGRVIKTFGGKHIISQYVRNSMRSARRIKEVHGQTRRVLLDLGRANGVHQGACEAQAAYEAISAAYPLLKEAGEYRDGGIEIIWNYNHRKERDERLANWAKYIQLVDRFNAEKKEEV